MGTLELLIIVCLLLWLGGYAFVPAAGSLVHVLLIVVIILIVVRLIPRRNL